MMMLEQIDSLIMLLGAAPPVSGTESIDTAVSAAEVNSVWDFVKKGGVMMIPIGIASLIAVTVFMERWVSLRKGRVIPGDFIPGLDKRLKNRPDRREAALKYCADHDSPLARVFKAGIRRLGEPEDVMQRHVEEAGEREALRLRKFLRVLHVIAAIAPLMGLLGTIFGMIRAFQTVAMNEDALGQAGMLAGGIYEAMITTAAGLIVAIPTLIAYHYLNAKIESLVMEIDMMTVEFIDQHARPNVYGDTSVADLHKNSAPEPEAVPGQHVTSPAT